MKNLKVVQFLGTMSALEFEKFEKYVHSPYFHTHQGTIDLFEALKDYYPDFPKEQIAKKKIFSQVFPDTPYDEKKIYGLGNYLYKLILQFMALQSMEKHKPLWEPIMTISSVEEHRLNKYLPKIFEEAEGQIEDFAFRDMEYFYYKYVFTEQKCNQVLRSQNRSAEVPLQSIADQLEYFVLISKLEIAIPFANKQSILTGEENHFLIKEALLLYENMQLPKPSTIQLFYAILKMLSEEEGSSYFQNIKKLLPTCAKELPPKKLYQCYLYAINFCSKMMKKGQKGYEEEVFGLFQQMLERDLLFYYPSTININFKNVVTIGLRLKKYPWVKKFIQNNGDKIDPEQQKSIVNYSLACLHFARQKYSEAKRLLAEMKFTDPFYRLSNDILLLKIYYETGDLDTLYFRSRAFTTFIQRNKTLADANKMAYANLAKFIRRLAKVRYEKKKNIARIAEDFAASKYLVERNWLAEKIEDLT